MPMLVSRVSSSSIASTKPTILNRREDSVRRKNQRSSSWSAWIPPPLLGQPSDKTSPVRARSLGRRASPDIAPPSGQKDPAEKKGSFRRWGKRKDKKSVTFDEDVGVSLEDFESAPGTVRRQKLSGIGPVPGIFPRMPPDEKRKRVPDPVSRVDFANRDVPATGNKVEGHTSDQGAHREYWSALRRQIEENAKLQGERYQRQATKNGIKEQDNRDHQRTVSRDDQLTARGANPRTGVVSPSVMSGGSSSVSRDSQEDNATLQKWRLKGNEWISLEPNEKSPFPSPSGNEIAQPEFPTNNPSPAGLNPSVSPAERAQNLTKPEDKFVVNMPSAREPTPLEMTTQQIVEFQKAIKRVHHEGEQMLDPDTLPTPRSITPTGISTPPRRFTKNIKEKILGRKRGAKLQSPPLSDKEGPKHDCGNGPAISPNIPVPDTRRTSWSEGNVYRKFSRNEETDRGLAISSQHNKHDLNREPFLGQSTGQREMCAPISLAQSLGCPHCPTPQWMNAQKFPNKKVLGLQEALLNHTANEEEFLGRSQPHYSLTMDQILHDGQTINGPLRIISRRNTKSESLTEGLQKPKVLLGDPLHKVTEQENPSTNITTMTPTSISTSTTLSSPPLEIDPFQLKPGTNPNPITIFEATSVPHSGTYCNHQPCRHWSEASSKSAITLNRRLEENVHHGTGSTLLNRSRNMHGSIPISESLNDCSNAHFTRYSGTDIQNQCYNTTMKIHNAQGTLVTTRLGHSPMDLNVISPIDKGIASQREGVGKEAWKPGPGIANPLTNRRGRPYMQLRDAQVMNRSANGGLLENENSFTLGAVTPTVQFFHYIVREHHTINFLRLAAIQFLTMILHCLKVTLRLCDCCHKFSKTGDLPRAPRNANEARILIIDIGRACIYFAIMVVVFTFLARGLGILATIASWLAWPVKVCGLL
ncbi:hypothetical protein ACJ72_05608 [Emergomyces africanus]|uniref:Uncharacterized protein n=1 Tax=Emergomyces africanus TaxID=1955775 RepID=A0A1B7NTY7_9EURO|nr:hypothetical protein ACJ72_05608 [Emergomyces africanus]